MAREGGVVVVEEENTYRTESYKTSIIFTATQHRNKIRNPISFSALAKNSAVNPYPIIYSV
jgi:hypothetical protein